MEFGRKLKSYRILTDQRLDQLIPPVSMRPEVLHEAMRYACLSEGKRLRPALVFGFCELYGGRPESALDAACAVEMVHAFSLVHDDLPAIDDDDVRRGQPATHKRFGEAIGLLAGDALFALAFQTLAVCAGDHAGRALEILAKATGSQGLVGGEVMDILAERSGGSHSVQEIHDRKTGALMSASCALGALFGGAEDLDVASSYGSEIGLAFQITDDLLNECSTATALGKAAGSDRLKGKLTYPTALGLAQAREAAEMARRRAEGLLHNLLGDTAFLRAMAAHSVERSR